jgi:hypothetical protein
MNALLESRYTSLLRQRLLLLGGTAFALSGEAMKLSAVDPPASTSTTPMEVGGLWESGGKATRDSWPYASSAPKPGDRASYVQSDRLRAYSWS